MSTKLRTCNNCNKVYFVIDRKKAQEEVTRANQFYKVCSEEIKKTLYKAGPATIKSYEECGCGNTYKNFRQFKDGDCRVGEFILPIIGENE